MSNCSIKKRKVFQGINNKYLLKEKRKNKKQKRKIEKKLIKKRWKRVDI